MSRKKALITGTSSGIGYSICRYLLAEGFEVFAGVRSQDDSQRLARELGLGITPIVLDIADSTSIAAAVLQLGGQLDVLINNAGMAYGGPFESLDLGEIRRLFEVNVFGHVALTQAVLPMLRQSKGYIINIGSLAGIVPQPFLAAYCASKHAMHAFFAGLKSEMRPFGVRVATIAPSAVKTPIWAKSSNVMTDMEASLTGEHRETYGPFIARFKPLLAKEQERAIPVSDVVAVVKQVLQTANPRTTYLVGPDARVGGMLKRLLPETILAKLVDNRFGL